jgi:L,D-transpeptidase YnhG
MTRHVLILSVALGCALLLAGEAIARKKSDPGAETSAVNTTARTDSSGVAEARLIEIYQLTAKMKSKDALSKAENLVRDFPNFQLAHLIYGDLLSARIRPIKTLGDIPEDQLKGAEPVLSQLREESQVRLKALRERPQIGSIPSEFLTLSPANKHAIAVDASRSRLYLFENSSTGMKLVGDYYISLGKSGLEKSVEGDLRTPLGIYFITSNLDPKSLKDIYGSGALPINYPNILDSKRGKTGKGIWLHGTPVKQFSRPPLASDGCIVLANPDLIKIIQTVEVRTTPVVISRRLNWVSKNTTQITKKAFEDVLTNWKNARSSGNFDNVLRFYSDDFNAYGKNLSEWKPTLRSDLSELRGRQIDLKNMSLLHWSDASETMVVTFGEVTGGQRAGPIKRQYWSRQGNQWKIFFEGII